MDIKQQIKKAILEGRNIRIGYRKFDGDISRRTVSNVEYNNSYEDDGFYRDHIRGYCHLRHEDRTFKINRITSIELL